MVLFIQIFIVELIYGYSFTFVNIGYLPELKLRSYIVVHAVHVERMESPLAKEPSSPKTIDVILYKNDRGEWDLSQQQLD